MAHHSRVAGVLVSASTLCLAHVGLALDVTVTTNSDVVDDTDGVVSLREAVADTNALTGPDTITFAAALSGQRIVLGSGPLEVADDLVIQGPGSSLLTVSNGNTNSGRVFWVQDGERTSQRSVTIVGLTIADGVSRDFDLGGAGIYNEEHLSLIDCRVTNNFDWMARGGGIRNAGTLSLSGCAIDHNQANVAGGGIYNSQGLLLVSDSTIADNVSVSLEGGGIYNLDGEVFIDRSTITDNAVNTSAQGGGLKNAGGDVTVTNSTAIFAEG